MPQIINTNIASLNAQRNLNSSQSANQSALQRLSSGLRINSAKDDAAGLAISTRFDSQIRGLNVAVRNAGDGISLAQTAEGALGSMNDSLQRIRELAVQSANATNSDADRQALQAEVEQMIAEVSRTASETAFNGRNLLDGSFEATFQIGANAGQTVDISIAELTAEKLGSAATAGVSAIGNSNALSNGDLVINGVSISASKAGDDTASTDNSSASAIAKAAAINRHSDETGVSATVNENVVSGSEMEGAALSGQVTINGVDIDIATTTSSSGSRAAVVEAVNAVAEQTGVRAVNTNSDTGGVQLIAEDGRNIQVSFSTLTSASTGIAAAGTYEGGYTLVADAATGSVEIDGGNGTGKGDLSNAGLVRGTYDRGVASSVSEVQSSTLGATTLAAAGGSLTNTIGNTNDTGVVLGAGGAFQNTVYTSAPDARDNATAASAINFRVSSAGGVIADVTVSNGASLTSAIGLLDTVAGINAFERSEIVITDFSTVTGGNQLYLAGATIALPSVSGANVDTQTERMEFLTDAINNATYAVGVTVTAELNFAKTAVSITIDNENTAGTMTIALGSSVNGAGTLTGNVVTAAGLGQTLAAAGVNESITSAPEASVIVGALTFEATGGVPITIQAFDGTAATNNSDFFSGGSVEFTSYGENNLASTSKNVVSVTVDGVSQTDLTVLEDSTVNDLATQINSNFSDVNAWEEISLTFDDTNLEVGDSIYIGTGTGGAIASGVAIAVSDQDADGSITLADIAESINSTNFSTQDLDISATLNADGTELNLTIRNFSGEEVVAATDAEGRSLQLSSGDLVGSAEQQFSGTLAYAATGSQEVTLSISDPETKAEFYSGNAVSTTFNGVNGLEDGDIIINGVSIGEAKPSSDTASAEYASDGTRILSSSKELSAIAVADAINAVSDETGVTAEVNATEVVGGDGTGIDTTQFAIGDTAEIYINGYTAGTVTLQDDGTGNIDTDRAKSDALNIVNSIAGKTGVSAVDNGVSLTLTAEDGRNVSIAIDDQAGADASIGALFGLDAAQGGIGESTFGDTPAANNNGISAESATYETTYGTITLKSAGQFTVAAGAEGADELNAVGLTEGSFGGAVDGTFLTDIDISTFEGATAALTAIDNAIGAIASQRADLGAIQNRMETTVGNLAITSENLSAANSRIRDADFAMETSELARSQVLQQAGISILAQANQLPQQVLSLLG